MRNVVLVSALALIAAVGCSDSAKSDRSSQVSAALAPDGYSGPVQTLDSTRIPRRACRPSPISSGVVADLAMPYIVALGVLSHRKVTVTSVDVTTVGM